MNRALGAAMLLIAGTMASIPGVMAEDYGIPAGIQEGNILHCFNWPAKDVIAELPQIAAAGFGSVQISPCQRADIQTGSSWHDLYRPYDLAFKSSSYCSEQDLKDLCAEAAKYGIKIIVDVVANHVDKTAGYHDPWWDGSGRVRWNGGINYGDRYSITHGQLGDYGDIDSENSEVQQRAKSYVEKLKELGVKGIRWDAAKHIGLPSEGCGFWSTVTSVPGMFHYGEILDAPGPNASIIKEYTEYMSVTDNKYCNYAARENGGIPGGYGGDWAVNQNVADTELVYWAESHDTYSNDEWSQNVDQATIDRAYAAYACRNGATALYLARPNTKGFNNIKVGKGSTAFKSKSVAEVNKFRNTMAGRADWFESNGNACSITRDGGGAVIVMKGSGNVSIANGGGYCPAGTYVDRVSGGTFTVTGSTITGNVGASGIAVIYKDGIEPDPTPDPEPDPTPDPDGKTYIYFDNTDGWNQPNVWVWSSAGNCTASQNWPGDALKLTENGRYYWELPEGKPQPENLLFINGTDESTKTKDLKFVNGATYKCDGSYTENVNPGPTPDPEPVPGELDEPTELYVLGDIEGALWDTAAGVPMELTEKPGVWRTVKKVTFVASSATATHCYFNLATTIGADWDVINSANRFGSTEEGVEVTPAKPATMKQYTKDVDASACKSWTVMPGSYYVVADFKTGTVSLAESVGIELNVAEEEEANYFTLDGIRVENPAKGLYIKVTGNKAAKVNLR